MSGIMSMLLGAVSSAAAAVDEFFNRVTLLLPGNGTNGAQNNTFLDSSTNNFTITRNGNTTQGTFSPFSQTGWSNFFDGSGDNLTSTQPALNATFTIEAWIYRTSGAALQSIVHLNNGGVSGVVVYLDTSNYLVCTDGVNAQAAFSNLTVPINAWTHIAVVRSGGTTTGYVNGTVAGSNSFTPATVSAANIGAYNGSLYFPGYISNVRVVNGSAVYTGAFTPPTSPLTAITNTSLLTCQNNRFIDNSSNAYTITRTGDVSVQTFSPFLPTVAYTPQTIGGSGYFDGTGDFLTIPYNTTDFDWWTTGTDFTLEAWIYPTTFTGWGYAESGFAKPTLVGNLDPSGLTNYWSFGPYTNGQIVFSYYNGASQQITGQTLIANQWNHIAMTKTSSGVTLFANGVGNTATAISGTPQSSASTTLTIGRGNNTNINGYVSGLRIVKGTAIYSGTTYTIPTAPVTAVTNTELLTNFTNAGITDATAKNDLETVGNAQISTTQSKFGGSSMYFDGTGDYLVAPSSQNYAFVTGDFTVEFWIFLAAGSKSQVILDTRASGPSSNGIAIAIDTSNNPYVYVNSATLFTSSTALSLNTWTHLAVVKSSGTITLYLNGTKPTTGSGSSSTSLTDTALTIGTAVDYRDTSTTLHLNGYIDDLRITKGFARYTANFTAPTSAFPLQ